MEGLSIKSSEVTNEDINITYTPSLSTSSYSYRIIKNNVYQDIVKVNNNTSTLITLKETGTYKIEIKEVLKDGKINTIISDNYIIDKEVPVISLKEKTIKILSGDKFNYNDYVSAKDNVDGSVSVSSNINDIDMSSEGIKTIELKAQDKAGNISVDYMYVTVKKNNNDLIFFGQVSILLITLVLISLLIKYIKSIKYEKRFSKYTINSSKNKSISLFDNLYKLYNSLILKFSKLLESSVLINNTKKRYEKYVDSLNLGSTTNIIAKKILMGILFVIISFIIKLIESMMPKAYEIIIPFILGYYTLDLVYFIKYIRYRKKIESDIVDAITIMNNAFKSGRSIIQAIDLVSRELIGPISNEFKKISLELSLGLDVDVAFKRFAERVNVEEAIYLTSSLSILNKTGGNIIKVFDCIEKTLYSKKKLKEELKSLTSSSKLIMYVLVFVPLIFTAFIALINKEYFNPLFNNPLGVALLILILIIYIAYIIIVRKIMKVRM